MNNRHTALQTAIYNYVDVLYIANNHLYADGQQWMSINPRASSMWFLTCNYGHFTMSISTIVRCLNLFLGRYHMRGHE